MSTQSLTGLSYGRQDKYLLSNPSITFFKVNYYKKLVYEDNIKSKSITKFDRNTECPISFDPINKGDKYYQCVKCKYNFLAEAFKFANNNKCPMCKCEWTSKLVYVNNNKIYTTSTK
jgi:hypothetical protein